MLVTSKIEGGGCGFICDAYRITVSRSDIWKPFCALVLVTVCSIIVGDSVAKIG